MAKKFIKINDTVKALEEAGINAEAMLDRYSPLPCQCSRLRELCRDFNVEPIYKTF